MIGAAVWLAVCAALLVIPAPSVAAIRLAGQADAALPTRRSMPVRWSAVSVALLCVAVMVIGVSAGPIVAVAVAISGGVAIRLLRAAVRTRHADRSRRALLTALRVLGAELAAGSREDAALEAAAGVAGSAAAGLRGAATAIRRGDPDGAVDVLAGQPLLAPLAAAWRVRTRAGAALVELVEHVERDLTDRLAQRAAVAAVLAGPRSSAGLLAALPLVGMVLASQVGANPIDFLTNSPAGEGVLLIGAVLDAAGLLWTAALSRRGELP
ncbi:MAG: type II secretion system F family protein [Jatrophihabitans sp.]